MTAKAEEEAAARARLEKEKREMQSLLQETQDDLESEKEGRLKAEKLRRQLNEVGVVFDSPWARRALTPPPLAGAGAPSRHDGRGTDDDGSPAGDTGAAGERTGGPQEDAGGGDGQPRADGRLHEAEALAADGGAERRPRRRKEGAASPQPPCSPAPALSQPPPPPPPPPQSKQSVEKAKAAVEGDRESLQLELRDRTTAFQESDKRRKNAEAGLSEAQSRITEDSTRLQDLTSQNERMKVRGRRGGRGEEAW